MGGFGTPSEVAGTCPSTEYYRNRTGANFGGRCSNNNCPAAGRKISHSAGMFDQHPSAIETKCLGCNQSFVPTYVWFYNCRVRLRKYDEMSSVFECSGSAMKIIQLDAGGNSSSIRVTALDEL